MAIKYRISESGIQKVVEILEGDTVVGVRKFSPKEISVSYSGDTVQINDTFTGNTLFEGPSADFVKSDNSAFAETAGDAVLAMTNLANNIKIDVRELDGIELVNDAIAPDLSAYVTNTALDERVTTIESTITTAVATAKTEIQVDIDRIDTNVAGVQADVVVLEEKTPHLGKVVGTSSGFNYFFTTYRSVRCNASSALTFTTTDATEYLLQIDGSWTGYGLSQVGAYYSVTSPLDVPNGSSNFYIENDDPTIVDPEFTFGYYDWLEANIDRGENRHVPLCNWMNTGTPAEGGIEIGEWIITLTPNTTYTWYWWAFTKVYGANNDCTISVERIRITEYTGATL